MFGVLRLAVFVAFVTFRYPATLHRRVSGRVWWGAGGSRSLSAGGGSVGGLCVPADRRRSPWTRLKKSSWRLSSRPRVTPPTGHARRWRRRRGCRSRRSGDLAALRPQAPPADAVKLSTDPQFIEKVVDVVGLYHHPPERAVVLCVDEKSQSLDLERSQPVLPMMPGMPERRTHGYHRDGLTSLFAAFDIADGSVISELHRQHRAIEFKKFLITIDKDRASRPRRAPDLRKLRHPQNPGSTRLAGETPAVPHAFHPARLIRDQPGRTLVRVPHRPEKSAAAPPKASRPSKPASAPGSPAGTPTHDRSSGPRPPKRSSNHSPICSRISGAAR